MDLETKWMLADYKYSSDTTFLLKTYILVDNLLKTWIKSAQKNTSWLNTQNKN